MKLNLKHPMVAMSPLGVNPDIGIERRIIGNLGKENAGVYVFNREYWYVHQGEQNLIAPDGYNLYTEKRQLLEQGRMLAEADVDENGDFVLQWYDPPIIYERPWLPSIYLTDDTYNPETNLPPLDHFYQLIAYRVITICWMDLDSTVGYEGERPYQRFPVPMPFIMFYGQEKEKDVGQLFIRN